MTSSRKESNKELTSGIVDLLPGLVWTALPDGRFDFVNGQWGEYTGFTADEAIGLGWQTAVHHEDLPELLERWRLILTSGEPNEWEARLRRRDGKYRWFLFRVKPLTNEAGQTIKLCGIIIDIEDRRRDEEALRTSEINLRQIVDSIPGLVCTMSPTGEVEYPNRQILEYFGKTFEELKNWAYTDAVHPDDLPRVIGAFANSIATGAPYDIEHRCRRADGLYRWFHVRALPVRDAEGRIAGWSVLLIDIDDRKRAEETVRANEHNLTQIVNTIPVLAWSARTDGSAEFFNRHYLDYVGLSTEQAKDWGWTSAVHPDDLNKLARDWQMILASGKSGESEARLRRRDGEYRWFLFRATPLRDERGRIVKWYGTNIDIEDRKRVEEALQRNEAFLAKAQRLSSTGSFWWRVATDETIWSEEIYRIFEVDQSAPLTIELIADRYHPEDIPLLEEVRTRAQRGDCDLEYQHRLLMPDGAVKYLHVIINRIRDQDDLEYIGAVQDVTERRLSEEALGSLRSELAHVARVTTLGALTASIAHEVNQPLSGIITNASTCLRMLDADPPKIDGAREIARRIIRDGNRASEVITRLRALFGKKNAVIEPVDLNEATREVMALSLSELQKNRVIVRTEFADYLPPVAGDRVQLQQVILNLLLNASDAMKEVADDRSKQLVVKTELDESNQVRLRVQDTGAGFDPENVKKLFEAFYTTKSGGMGIGLSVSRSIIDSHQGRLWALPNDGGPGATFSFSIPCSSEGVKREVTGTTGSGAMETMALTNEKQTVRED